MVISSTWITGAGGLIGNYLCKTAPEGFEITQIHSDHLALSAEADLRLRFDVNTPSVIIHCAAISKGPVCEANPELAREVNTNLTKRLSEMAKDILFIFLSTDLVFDGRKGNYTEDDAPNPLSVYAETKARAEEFVLRNREHTVIRTSLNAGHSPTGDRAFNEEIHKAFVAGKPLNFFADEFRCPISAEITARAIWEIAGATSGLYHLCGSEKLSRYEIGELLARCHPELNPKIMRGSLRDYKGAPRSPDTSMDCSKIQAELSFQLPKFSDWVRAQPPGSL